MCDKLSARLAQTKAIFPSIRHFKEKNDFLSSASWPTVFYFFAIPYRCSFKMMPDIFRTND
jgi:hypothetical protein